MSRNAITVAVAGGRELDRAGLAALIAGLPGLHIVPVDTEAPPQVLIWMSKARDLPPMTPETVILLLTEEADLESLPVTVTGLFSRDEPPSTLGSAIRQVAGGEQYISPSLAVALLQKRQAKSSLTESQKRMIVTLTGREREILDLLAEGMCNKAIAARLYLSVRTVEGHLANIYLRLGVHSRTEAMLIAVKIPKGSGTIVR